jgi:hypothetical protein
MGASAVGRCLFGKLVLAVLEAHTVPLADTSGWTITTPHVHVIPDAILFHGTVQCTAVFVLDNGRLRGRRRARLGQSSVPELNCGPLRGE